MKTRRRTVFHYFLFLFFIYLFVPRVMICTKRRFFRRFCFWSSRILNLLLRTWGRLKRIFTVVASSAKKCSRRLYDDMARSTGTASLSFRRFVYYYYYYYYYSYSTRRLTTFLFYRVRCPFLYSSLESRPKYILFVRKLRLGILSLNQYFPSHFFFASNGGNTIFINICMV